MRYRAVIFDLFGTLVHSFVIQQHATHISQKATGLGLPADKLSEVWGKTRKDRETGRFATIADNLRFVCAELRAVPSEEQIENAARAYLESARAAHTIRHDAVATLEAIKNAGHQVGLVSDCAPHVPSLWPTWPLAPLVDIPIFSCSVGVKKPDPRIYLLACEQLAVHPSECLYVGDGGSQELTGASKVGMTAVQVAAVPKNDSLIIDGESWQGRRLETLSEVLRLL